MAIEIINSDNKNFNQIPIVGSFEYLNSKSSKNGWFYNGNFLLPFIIERRAIFNRLVFTHQTITLNEFYSIESEYKFLNEVKAAAADLKVDFIYQPMATAVFSVVPEGAIYAPFGTYIVDLEISSEHLWANIHAKHRNVIKRAIHDGVQITESSDNIFVCYELILSTMIRNKKLPVRLSELKKLSENLKKNASFYVAWKENAAQGVAVIIWSEGSTAYYLYGGTSASPSLGSMNLLHWTAMINMKARGVKKYDFVGARLNPPEGSKLQSIQRFKKRFGATIREGYLWKYPLKPLNYSAYRLLARANSLVHGVTYRGDIIDEELSIVQPKKLSYF